jgi:hypothetical protein
VPARDGLYSSVQELPRPIVHSVKALRGLFGWALVWAAPLAFFGWIRTPPYQGTDIDLLVWPLAVPVLLIVGRRLTKNTPLSTEAGIERRKRRVKANRSGFADRFWIVATNVCVTYAILRIVGAVGLRHLRVFRNAFGDVPINPLGWSLIMIQTAFPLSLASGAWHRTRWGFKPERLAEGHDVEAPLVGRTAADVAFKICIALLVLIASAFALQFSQPDSRMSNLWNPSDRPQTGFP